MYLENTFYFSLYLVSSWKKDQLYLNKSLSELLKNTPLKLPILIVCLEKLSWKTLKQHCWFISQIVLAFLFLCWRVLLIKYFIYFQIFLYLFWKVKHTCGLLVVDSYFSNMQTILAVFKDLMIPFTCTYTFIKFYGNLMKCMYLLLRVVSQVFKNMPSGRPLKYGQTLIS